MNRPTACPSPERLRALLDNLASDFEADALTAHLDACPECRRRLDALVGGPETSGGLASKLRLEPGELSPALQAVLNGLRPGPIATADVAAGPARPEHEPAEPSSGPLPRHVGPYRVEGLIGVGGMGRVLKAFDPNLRRVVALKQMSDALAANATARGRFKREARAAASIAHEHVVTIHEIEEQNGIPYIVMQFVKGKSLQERINEAGPLGLREVLRIGSQIAAGLAAAHAQGIVHRDVKPSNILLENGVERVKITDFGLARVNDDLGETVSGVIAGTPQYMSPEQAKGEALDHRSDLFSLGAVLYAMCTGEPPFSGGHPLSILKRVCEQEPKPPRQLNPEVPEWLGAIIGKLMAKEPAERFQSADEVAGLLGRHLAHLQQPTTVAMPEPVARDARRPAAWYWYMIVLLVIAGLAVFLSVRARRPPFTGIGGKDLAIAGAAVLALLLLRVFRGHRRRRHRDAHHHTRRKRFGLVLLLLLIVAGAFMFGMGRHSSSSWPGVSSRGQVEFNIGPIDWNAKIVIEGPNNYRQELDGDRATQLRLNPGMYIVTIYKDGQVICRDEAAIVENSRFMPGEMRGEVSFEYPGWPIFGPGPNVRIKLDGADVGKDLNEAGRLYLLRVKVGRHKWEAVQDGAVVDRGEFFLYIGEKHFIRILPRKAASKAEIDKLRRQVEVDEKLLKVQLVLFEAGQRATWEVGIAESTLIESSIQLAVAEGRTADRLRLLRALVARRTDVRDGIKGRVDLGKETTLVLIESDRKLADAQAELREAEAEAGPEAKADLGPPTGEVVVIATRSGKPEADVPVTLIAQYDADTRVQLEMAQIAIVETDREGRAVFRSVGPGSYRVKGPFELERGPSFESKTIRVKPKETTQVRLER